MEQRVSLITLGVADLARARRFYERLGWHGQEVEQTVFFQAGGQAVVLWDRAKLAADAGVDDDGTCSFAGMVLAHNVRSVDEVDQVVRRAAAAGATVTRPPADTFYGGHAGCFRDPDGHVWEVAFNPGFPLGPSGELTVPRFDDAAPKRALRQPGPLRGRVEVADDVDDIPDDAISAEPVDLP